MEERAEVMQALLELDCMPAGMELFPAANEEQWDWIKRVIDESDYYVVVIGGRYGSISTRTALSYTEMEYRYALEIGKPSIAFLHEDPARITAGKTETSPQARRKLEAFRRLLEQRLCKYWNSPADLGAKVSRGVTQLMKHSPAIGWIRADQVPQDQTRELLQLQRELEQMRERLALAGVSDNDVVQSLARGRDKFAVHYVAEMQERRIAKNGRTYWGRVGEHSDKLQLTWDDLFLDLAGHALSPVREDALIRSLNMLLKVQALPGLEKRLPDKRFNYFRVYGDSFDTVKLQLRALGLIDIASDGTWKLTKEGERYFIRLRAVHRKTPQVVQAGAPVAPAV